MTRLEHLALLLILLLAAALRLGWPGVNSFAFDEARLSLIALGMARGGDFATLGMPSSAGVPNLPAAAWLFAIPYTLSPDPAVATVFVGLLGLATVAGTWWLARRLWGAWAALIAALILATHPYSVLYARNIWAQNLLPPLALAWALTAHLAATSGRRGWLALHVFIAGFTFQVHLAGVALALGTGYLLLRWRWVRQPVAVVIGGGLAALTLLPFAWAWFNQPTVAAAFTGALGGPTQYDLAAFDNLLRVAFAREWGFLAAGERLPATTPLLAVVGLAGLIIAGIGGMTGVAAKAPSTGTSPALRLYTGRGFGGGVKPAELILVWLFITPLFFVRHSTPVFPHYILPSLPALALLIGASVCMVERRIWRVIVLLSVTALALLWSGQIAHSLTVAGAVVTPNGLGTPLGLLRDAAYSLPDDAPVLLFTHGDDPDTDGEAAIFAALWWGREQRIVRGDSLLILPDHPAYLMATLAPFPAWESLRASGLAPDDAIMTLPRRDGTLPFVAVRYDGEQEPDGFTPVEPVTFASGARLEGWRVQQIGPRWRVETRWRVIGSPLAATIQQFHHLRPVAAPDAPPLMVADVPLSVHDWRAGDHLIVMGDFLDVAPGTYTVEIGHYTLPDVTRLTHTGGGDSVRLGPVGVE